MCSASVESRDSVLIRFSVPVWNTVGPLCWSEDSIPQSKVIHIDGCTPLSH